MHPTLEKIKQFADKAHGTQMRKYVPDRYIVHPIRVMETCMRFTDDICILAAALLHDVLEDTDVDAHTMKEFLLTVLTPAETVRTMEMVIDLTDVYVKKVYPSLNRRTRKAKETERLSRTSADSQTIKYADTIDNTKEMVVHDPDFAKIFLFECRSNLRQMDKGNPELYREAMETINKGIEALMRK